MLYLSGACVGAAGRSRFRFPKMSLEFFVDNLSGRTMALGLTQPLTKMSNRNISWGLKAAGAQGWQLYHFHVPIFQGVSTSWNPEGLSRPILGLRYSFYLSMFRKNNIYLYTFMYTFIKSRSILRRWQKFQNKVVEEIKTRILFGKLYLAFGLIN